ncbi:DUF6326 family protein [Colwellia piezophila]|uniref:DUF6326 family protein n=1 Tax=Colwellia piezophila TaxID=211668 RepID=UPI0003635DFA|nr:DUF6326 family protein [Colwellia piezophila]
MKQLEDIKINIKIKLSALWATLMFMFIYADFISLMIPGRVMGFNDGTMGLGTTTPMKLVIVAVLMSVPALMVYLSLGQKAKFSKVLNILFGAFYAIIMTLTVYSSISEWRSFYIVMGVIEIFICLSIVWSAWRWPKANEPLKNQKNNPIPNPLS